MTLSWSSKTGIAKALLRAYPDIDRLSLDHTALIKLVTALPDFQDNTPPPGTRTLSTILWTWMRLADGAAEGSAG